MEHIIETKLMYGQKVYLALAKCACSDTVHDIKYSKVGSGFVRKYLEENDSYMVEIENDGTGNLTYCPCGGYDVGHDSTKVTLKEIKREHIFVTGISSQYTIGEWGFEVGDIVNIYPYSGKYKIIAINSERNMILGCNVTGLNKSGTINISDLVIVDLADEGTYVVPAEEPLIPYTYKVETDDEETPTEEQG